MPFWSTFTPSFGAGRRIRKITPIPAQPTLVNMSALVLPSGVTLNTANTIFTGRSLEFDGTQVAGSLDFDLTAEFGLQNSITIDAWIYYTTSSDSKIPWTVENVNQFGGPMTFNQSGTRKLGWYQNDRTARFGSSLSGGASMTTDQWSLVSCEIEYNGTTTRARRYFNGTSNITAGVGDYNVGVAGDNDYSMPGMPTFVLGNSGNSNFFKFVGLIGPIRISRGLRYNSTSSAVATAAWELDDDTIVIIQ